jgi:hypothetical protein
VGSEERELVAIDTSTIARLRAGARLAWAGKGFCHRAGRAVRANIVAAATSIVMIRGVRVGLVRRTRFGARCEDAVETLFHALPPRESKRLILVDAGIATQERFAAATDQDALLGRLRINSTLRCAPPPPSGKRGHPTWHGPVLHPGAVAPEVEPAEEFLMPGDKGDIRVRRWNALHFAEARHTILDVLRLDDPAYQRPLVVGTTARELTTEEGIVKLLGIIVSSGHSRHFPAAMATNLPLGGPLCPRDFRPTLESLPHLSAVLRRGQQMPSWSKVLSNGAVC